MKVLLSIQTGCPVDIPQLPTDWAVKRPWQSGFHKTPRIGSVWLGRTHLEGDGQADLVNHGGVDKAVNVYPMEHYEYWNRVFPWKACQHGAFGENFTTQGLREQDVCIGDIFGIGAALVQVSQPRQPCWKLSHMWGVKDLARQVEQSGRTGWYVRVLQEGMVSSGMEIELKDRPFPQFTIAVANDLMCRRSDDRDLLQRLSQCPALSASWQTTFSKRLGMMDP